MDTTEKTVDAVADAAANTMSLVKLSPRDIGFLVLGVTVVIIYFYYSNKLNEAFIKSLPNIGIDLPGTEPQKQN